MCHVNSKIADNISSVDVLCQPRIISPNGLEQVTSSYALSGGYFEWTLAEQQNTQVSARRIKWLLLVKNGALYFVMNICE